MFSILFKYNFLILNALYIYFKILPKRKIRRKYVLISLLFALFISFLISLLGIYTSYVKIPLMVISCCLFLVAINKKSKKISVIIISFGIDYALFTISTIISSTISALITNDLNYALLLLFSGIIEFLLVFMLFRIKRLRNGMPFLTQGSGNKTGLLISIIILISNYMFGVFITTPENIALNLAIMLIPLFLLTLYFAALFLKWWSRKIRNTYLEHLRKTEYASLQKTIQNQADQIKYLEQHNDALAKLIHKDNKFIPALELAVRDYLETSRKTGNAELVTKGQELFDYIQEFSNQRNDFLHTYNAANKRLPSTKIYGLDSLLSYMQRKSSMNDIMFDLTLTGSVKYMVENVISENDLSTILADLIENSIISVKYSRIRNILVNIGIVNDHYCIDVIDSGIPFEVHTLVALGLEKATTHAKEGGSGIGLMAIYEIVRSYKASLCIEEFPDQDGAYTKKVTILFDNQGQYLIKTTRADKIKTLTQRPDLILLKQSF